MKGVKSSDEERVRNFISDELDQVCEGEVAEKILTLPNDNIISIFEYHWGDALGKSGPADMKEACVALNERWADELTDYLF